MSEPKVAKKGPYAVEVEAGKTYYWCACGLSAAQPFCDGSHKSVGAAPMAFTAERSGEVHFCGCKRSGAKPMCDGSHRNV